MMKVSSTRLAAWYAQMATCLDAGLSWQRAVETASGLRTELRRRLVDALGAGLPLDEALARGGAWLPRLDRELIAAGTAAGRTPEMLRRLAARHEAAARARRQVLAASAYPLIVAHLAAFALPVAVLMQGAGVEAYLPAVLKVLIPLWGAVAVLAWAARRRLRPLMAVLDVLPGIGGYRRYRALADLAFVLQAQVMAGIRLDEAWRRAARASGDTRLEAVAGKVAETVRAGLPVSLALAGERRSLPAPFAEFWENGERTGALESALAHLYRHFGDLAARRLAAASFAYPKVLFAAVAIWVAVQALQFYAGYFQQLEELMQP